MPKLIVSGAFISSNFVMRNANISSAVVTVPYLYGVKPAGLDHIDASCVHSGSAGAIIASYKSAAGKLESNSSLLSSLSQRIRQRTMKSTAIINLRGPEWRGSSVSSGTVGVTPLLDILLLMDGSSLHAFAVASEDDAFMVHVHDVEKT